MSGVAHGMGGKFRIPCPCRLWLPLCWVWHAHHDALVPCAPRSINVEVAFTVCMFEGVGERVSCEWCAGQVVATQGVHNLFNTYWSAQVCVPPGCVQEVRRLSGLPKQRHCHALGAGVANRVCLACDM